MTSLKLDDYVELTSPDGQTYKGKVVSVSPRTAKVYLKEGGMGSIRNFDPHTHKPIKEVSTGWTLKLIQVGA